MTKKILSHDFGVETPVGKMWQQRDQNALVFSTPNCISKSGSRQERGLIFQSFPSSLSLSLSCLVDKTMRTIFPRAAHMKVKVEKKIFHHERKNV